VSAILVVLNQIDPLRRAVAALDRSTDRERLEILVVDLGSEDGSAQIDAEFPATVMLRLPHNFGATKAMNIGTRTAKGDLMFYLSPEVEVATDTVAKLADKLEQDSDAAAVCPVIVDGSGKLVSRIYKLPTAQSFKGEMPSVAIDVEQESVNVEYPGREAIMVRKQFVKGMNYFDERFGEYWADADLAMQVHRAQKKIQLYPGIRAIYRPERDPLAGDPLLKADRALGAAVFLGKYNGFMAGLGFRIAAIFRALGRLDLRQFTSLVSGQKLDGSQAG